MKYRWCVLEHLVGDAQNVSHFDFLFENPAGGHSRSENSGGRLLAWAIVVPSWCLLPWTPPHDTGVATQLTDHRRIYLEYEGEIGPAPGDPLQRSRGHVRRMARGFFDMDTDLSILETPVDSYQFRMTTESAPSGTWRLTLTPEPDARKSLRWRYRMEPVG